jgi:hypothetical protein
MNIKTGGLRQKELARISKQRAFILRGSGVLPAGENSDDVASGKAAMVTGLEGTATVCG